MPTPSDELFLRRAIRLAMNGRGLVEPNPMVGCVLVKNGQIIGEGWHGQFGGPHAEPTALADCRSRGNSPEGATAYVTLEPCCHTNKKTPPCVPALVEAKVARVVIGCLDPNPAVNGQGVALLRAAGIEVATSVCEGEAKQLIAPFLARHQFGRPYVTLKWAQTADKKVAAARGKRMHITCGAANHLVHRLRAASDAIVIGARTMAVDDPILTARNVALSRPLLRVVLSSQWIELGSNLLRTTALGPVLLYHANRVPAAFTNRLAEGGVLAIPVAAEPNGHVQLNEVLADLARREVTHCLVEAGPTLGSSFLASNRVDRLWVFAAPIRVDDESAPSAPTIPAHYQATGRCDVATDQLIEYLNPMSDLFFRNVPSADFILAANNPMFKSDQGQ